MIKLYLARGMTGRIKEEVVREALLQKLFFERLGFKVLCPVSEEKVKPTKEILISSKKDMDKYWKRDKQLIRESNIVIDMTPTLKSEGVAHELAYARYHLWKPVIRLYKHGEMPSEGSVARFEDDALFDDVFKTAYYINDTYGTRWKRFKWRLALINRCLLRAIWHHILEWGK